MRLEGPEQSSGPNRDSIGAKPQRPPRRLRIAPTPSRLKRGLQGWPSGSCPRLPSPARRSQSLETAGRS
eukprot:9700276-Alexandrium_andersonii.AAC.1